MATQKTELKQISSFVPKEEKEAIKAKAEAEDRTVSNYVRRVIMKDIKQGDSE